MKKVVYDCESLPNYFCIVFSELHGDGKVVYMFDKELDYDAIEEVVAKVYDGDASEYDPSTLDSTIAGEIQDEISAQQIVDKIDGDLTSTAKLEQFLKTDVLDNDIPLVYIDTTAKKITQISDSKKLQKLLVKDEETMTLFIREYDSSEDY